jgi:small subunit ribosomal protein S19e
LIELEEYRMANVYSVPGTELVKEIAKDLKENKKIAQPPFVEFVKTSCSKERAPDDLNWYYTRMASILRRIYIDGPVGVQRLRTYYGGRKNRGVKPHHFKKGSGKIVRSCLQALEKEGLIKKDKKGRVITPKGQSYLNKKSKEVLNKIESEKNKRIVSALKPGEERLPKKTEAKEEKEKVKRNGLRATEKKKK